MVARCNALNESFSLLSASAPVPTSSVESASKVKSKKSESATPERPFPASQASRGDHHQCFQGQQQQGVTCDDVAGCAKELSHHEAQRGLVLAADVPTFALRLADPLSALAFVSLQERPMDRCVKPCQAVRGCAGLVDGVGALAEELHSLQPCKHLPSTRPALAKWAVLHTNVSLFIGKTPVPAL